ncbi:PH domain-containing protein [Pseudonocardia sp. KRD-184]|uniref:PH domain-containing protein n=1 Tax=Pseudonocardia oceani TaxID=2792013 RepID=A0ABS6U6G4_9PSEU|nr:PH domain-containing protein [Pseudonocardia oceani]MBW0091494.1 PH domain-containing protein [Pseudonocardia oceani]MBW0097379.1 PH domain-containing protein [Pseudonocardia oceani]MBW0110016.1 PH domain-containing protein [Pseudonocardia oceani]MBW0125048.1 PH domain-containing protein [Pseudonocardia oceani]MBW0127818.1 PH domain-containing protein [Pseudonocardia oceani]
MAYPDDLLVDGERVVLHTHPHATMLLGPVLHLLLVVAVGVFLAALVREQTWAPWAWLALGVVGAGLAVWLTLVPVVRWRTTHFVVTTRRVLVREGVLARTGIDIPMSRIHSVRFRHTVLERVLGCGTLVIESASDEPLEFTDVPRVERVHALLYQEVADDV